MRFDRLEENQLRLAKENDKLMSQLDELQNELKTESTSAETLRNQLVQVLWMC